MNRIFLIMLFFFAAVPVYAADGKVFFNPHIKTCIGRATYFYAKSDNEEIFKDYVCKWDFGDGSTAEGREVKDKIYMVPGIYKVALTLYDDENKVAYSAHNRVVVYSPPIAEAGEDIITCLGKSVILDASRSRATNLIERCFNCNLLTYIWEFGDGSASAMGVKVKHNYKKAGLYKATLTVRDGKGRKCAQSTDTVSILVNDPPYIILKEAKQACAGSPVALKAFVNASKTEHVDRDSLRYFWDFGDGMAQEGGPDMSHAYNNGGEYLVRVLADDRLGTECSNYTATMKVKINSPPVVKVGPNLVCCANVKSSFEASCSSGPGRDTLVYDWDFGDGATARGAKVTHVFKKAGKYKITLRVDDNFGTPCSSSTESFEVDVRAEPVAIMEIR